MLRNATQGNRLLLLYEMMAKIKRENLLVCEMRLRHSHPAIFTFSYRVPSAAKALIRNFITFIFSFSFLPARSLPKHFLITFWSFLCSRALGSLFSDSLLLSQLASRREIYAPPSFSHRCVCCAFASFVLLLFSPAFRSGTLSLNIFFSFSFTVLCCCFFLGKLLQGFRMLCVLPSVRFMFV